MSKIVKKTEIELKNIIELAVKKAVSNGALPEAEMPQFNIESRLIRITAIIQQTSQWRAHVLLRKRRE